MKIQENNSRKIFTERNKLLVLSLAVGIAAGLAAVLLTSAIDLIKHLCTGRPGEAFYWRLLILPGIGMLLSLLLLKFAVRDNIGHGVTKVLLAISRNESRIKPHNMWSSLLTSSITIGFGGSVGAEAPIVYTGAAIGSNLGRWSNLSFRNITILLGCGAAAAVAGIFRAPLAGVLFTMEILLFNVSMSTMLPLLIATISATVVAYIFHGQNYMFECSIVEFSMRNIPFYIIMGGVLGLCSLYFNNTTLWLEDKIAGKGKSWSRWIFCAVGLGLLIFLFPPLYGEGYDLLQLLLNGSESEVERGTLMTFLFGSPWGVPVFFLLVFLLKVVAMTLTNAGGGVGGTFGPTLFAGAIMGFVVARCFNLAGASVPEQNFVLVGMAALMAGVMQAPMTAIFLIAEISGGYDLLIPLILTSTISFGTTRLFGHYSIYTKRIAQSGDLLTHDNDQAVLTLLQTKSLVRDKYPRIDVNASLGEFVETITGSDAAVVAVVDSKDRFEGMIDIANARKYLFKTDLYDSLHVYNIMETAPAFIGETEKMESVIGKFERTGAWRLPVLDSQLRYVGFISKSRILMAYRSELKELNSAD